MSPVVLPPALFYGLGVLLLVFGALRAWLLGWKVKREEREANAHGSTEVVTVAADKAADGAAAPVAEEDAALESAAAIEARSRRMREAKRHLRYGVVWIVLGLFLIISTLVKAGGS